MRFISSLFKKVRTSSKDIENEAVNPKTITAQEIGDYFNIAQITVHEILSELHWVKEDNTPTKNGIKYGAMLLNNNEVIWENSILKNEIFISKINTKINTLFVTLSKLNQTKSDYAYIA